VIYCVIHLFIFSDKSQVTGSGRPAVDAHRSRRTSGHSYEEAASVWAALSSFKFSRRTSVHPIEFDSLSTGCSVDSRWFSDSVGVPPTSLCDLPSRRDSRRGLGWGEVMRLASVPVSRVG
jgi:hypothetical protein